MANFDMHGSLCHRTVRDFADEAQPDGALPETGSMSVLLITVSPVTAAYRLGDVLPLLLKQRTVLWVIRVWWRKYYPAARGWVDFFMLMPRALLSKIGIGDHESWIQSR